MASSPSGVVFSSGRDTSCGSLGACVMGFRGIGIRAGMLRELPGVQVPTPCFLADDVLITHHFRSRGFLLKCVHSTASPCAQPIVTGCANLGATGSCEQEQDTRSMARTPGPTKVLTQSTSGQNIHSIKSVLINSFRLRCMPECPFSFLLKAIKT